MDLLICPLRSTLAGVCLPGRWTSLESILQFLHESWTPFSSCFHRCVVSFGHSWAVPIVYLSIFQKSHRFTRLWRGVIRQTCWGFFGPYGASSWILWVRFSRRLILKFIFKPTSVKKGMSKGSLKSHCTNHDSGCVLVILALSFSLDCLICWNSLSFCINSRSIDWLMDLLSIG